MFSNQTVEKITTEYKQELNTYDVEKMVKVLEKAIDLPIDEESLSGIQRKYNYCIGRLFDSSNDLTDDDRSMVAENFFNIEPLLKKMLFLVNREKYEELKRNRSLECGPLLDNLHILESIRTHNGYLNLKTDPNKYSGSNAQEDHILRTYTLRNVTAHEMRNWSRLELYSNIQDVMITALYVCWKNKKVINELYDRNDINDQINIDGYIDSIIKNYENNLRNGFVFVPINWNYMPNILNGDYSEKESEKEIDITQFSSKLSPNSHILLLGGSGCGKSTSIDYLEFQSAKLRRSNKETAPIPVKILLAETNENWISIEEAICDRLRISYDICERLLSRGAIQLYLDGVNEIVSSIEIKKNVVRQIEKFLSKYKNVFVLITDRENVEIEINSNIQKYCLHQMGENDIRKYVDTRSLKEDEKQALVKYALDMSTEGVKFTPIILNFLTAYLKNNGCFPEDSTELYLSYIKNILKREYNEKKDINAAPGRLDILLEYLSTKMDDNSLNYISTMRAFTQCVDYLGMANIDTKNCIDLSLQLGILEQEGDILHFSNQEYYLSLLAKAIESGMEEWNLD